MVHVRQRIREQVAALLVTAGGSGAAWGARVYQSRILPVQTASLPCALVYALQESASTVTHGRGTYRLERSLTLVVELIAQANADLDDALDAMAAAAETAIAGADPLTDAGGRIAQSHWLSATEIGLSGAAEKQIGVCRLSFTVQYDTAGNAPGTSL